jgi:hypothetical protein
MQVDRDTQCCNHSMYADSWDRTSVGALISKPPGVSRKAITTAELLHVNDPVPVVQSDMIKLKSYYPSRNTSSEPCATSVTSESRLSAFGGGKLKAPVIRALVSPRGERLWHRSRRQAGCLSLDCPCSGECRASGPVRREGDGSPRETAPRGDQDYFPGGQQQTVSDHRRDLRIQHRSPAVPAQHGHACTPQPRAGRRGAARRGTEASPCLVGCR